MTLNIFAVWPAAWMVVYHTTWWVGSCIVYGISLEDYLHRIWECMRHTGLHGGHWDHTYWSYIAAQTNHNNQTILSYCWLILYTSSQLWFYLPIKNVFHSDIDSNGYFMSSQDGLLLTTKKQWNKSTSYKQEDGQMASSKFGRSLVLGRDL